MTSTFRTAEGGRIDRATTVEFTFDGQTYTGHPGDTLASALLAAGRHQVATSIKLGRPRGIAAAWAEDPSGLVQIEEPFPEPMLLATTVELHDGLVAHGLPGQGRLAEVPDSARYDAVHHHVDVLVVGAGPGRAGRRTHRRPRRGAGRARRRAVRGRRLAAVGHRPARRRPALMGRRRGRRARRPPGGAAPAAHHRLRQLRRRLRAGAASGAPTTSERPRPSTCPGSGCGASGPGPIVVATGAHERPVVFADNDRPGIMLAGAARTFLHRYGVLPGREAVVFTTNDSAYDAALDLHRAGVRGAGGGRRPAGGLAAPARGVRARGIRGPARAVVTGTQRRRAGHARPRRPVRGRRGRRRAPRSPATCCWSAAAGTPRCTCSARPAAGSRYDDGARRVPPRGGARRPVASPARPPVCSTWPGAWPTGSAWPAPP